MSSDDMYILIYCTDEGAKGEFIRGPKKEIYNYVKQINLTGGFEFLDVFTNKTSYIDVVFYDIAKILDSGPKKVKIDNNDLTSQYIKNIKE